ncbi:hypothetical protein ACGFS9_22355 [Streptomyces sp. NPDC048566]|uniref:hypothetical protein n=1 Tax=Streptomyces sp. NPDC048566 TaxID=3365569 RepID=UPI0037243047
MSDALELTVLGAGLPAAFGFLFGHLDRIVGRHLARRDGAAASGEAEEPVALPACLDGDPGELTPDLDLADRLAGSLQTLYGRLGPYALDAGRLSPQAPGLADDLGALRTLLEAIYGTRLTFHGESREATSMRATVDATAVEGTVKGIEMRGAWGSEQAAFDASVTARHVGPTGRVVGIEVDTTGRGESTGA